MTSKTWWTDIFHDKLKHFGVACTGSACSKRVSKSDFFDCQQQAATVSEKALINLLYSTCETPTTEPWCYRLTLSQHLAANKPHMHLRRRWKQKQQSKEKGFKGCQEYDSKWAPPSLCAKKELFAFITEYIYTYIYIFVTFFLTLWG